MIKPARGDPVGVPVEVEPFGSARPYPEHSGPARQTGANAGDAYVEFDFPEAAVRMFVGPRNTTVIPTETPLALAGRNAVFVSVRGWQFWRW